MKSKRQKDINVIRRRQGKIAGGVMPLNHKYYQNSRQKKLAIDIEELVWSIIKIHFVATGMTLNDAMRLAECYRAVHESRKPLMVNYAVEKVHLTDLRSSLQSIQARISKHVWKDCVVEAASRLEAEVPQRMLSSVGYTGRKSSKPTEWKSPILEELTEVLDQDSAADISNIGLTVSDGPDSSVSLAGELTS